MSALPERRQPIDIEEFERRLRAPEPPKVELDPLAELARLVSGHGKAANDPFATLFDQPRAAEETQPTLEPIVERRPTPELRGAYDHPHDHAPVALADENYSAPPDFDDWADELAPAPPPPARSRRPLFITAAVIAAGFVGIGATLAWQGGSSTKGEIATIKATTGPVKVLPQNTETAEAPGRDSTILDKSAKAPTVKQVVTREETPIDVSQTAKSPRVIPMSEGATSAAISGATNQASVAATPPAPIRMEAQPNAVFPEPKKVKTVAVRPDGSIISSATANTPSASPQPQRPPANAANAAKNATPKSNVRVATTPKGESETATKAKPVAVAKLTPVKPKQEARNQPADDEEETATATAPAASGGAYLVQLAAAGSEAEGRQTAQRLGEKFSSAFGGRKPSVQKAADKDVYRVRIGGMSKESATAACEKVKASGGSCFVAHN